MVAPVKLYPLDKSAIAIGGTSVIAMYGPLAVEGRVTNPLLATDQGVLVAEDLYVNIYGPASLAADGTTFALAPGQTFTVPAGVTGNVWVNAASSGHRFSGYSSSPYSPDIPASSGFPPPGPTTLTKIIPSFLYQEYNDDEDLQAFVDQFNLMAQEYADWFAFVKLPVYAENPAIVADLLDWIGAGLYGYPRPSLPYGLPRTLGPLNTYAPNVLAPNQSRRIGSQTVYLTTDDIYKRCLTWHLWKGDGKVFTIKWLKRRIMRFLTGTDGGPGQTADTSIVSVTFGVNNQVNIRIAPGVRRVVGGAVPGLAIPNNAAPNVVTTVFVPGQYIPNAVILKAAIDAGVLELPFQFTYVVDVA